MLLHKLADLIFGYGDSEKIYKKYKLANSLYNKGYKRLAHRVSHKIYKKYKCCISEKAIIGKNVNFPHPVGIVIGSGVQIGDNCTIYQNVTIGRKSKDIENYPKIQENVIVYCNSCLIGDITIGKNSVIGCNSVVLKSVPENAKCIGVVK